VSDDPEPRRAAAQITELRAGHLDGAGMFVPAPGGSLIHDLAIDPTAQESVPDTESIRTLRATRCRQATFAPVFRIAITTRHTSRVGSANRRSQRKRDKEAFMARATVMNRFVKGFCVVVGLAMVAGTVSYAAGTRIIRIEDQCDPETFNAVFGDATCVSSHPGVAFEHFINELLHTQRAGGWMFSARQVNITEGQQFQARNDGGEVHTFTEVDEFGGGFIPELNDLSGNPVPAPECIALTQKPGFPLIDELIPAGGKSEAEDEDAGTHHYQCCIHPWMRMDVTVR
jgi:hypothetical protein